MNLSDEAREFLDNNNIKNYTINPDGMVDVDDVAIFTGQSKLPVKFGRVNGHFYCSHTRITSLEGLPNYVGGNFYCNYNALTSLHDVHKYLKELNGYFYCFDNPIKDSVLGIFIIKNIKGIDFDDEINKILNKHIKQGRAGIIGAQQELLDAGLDEYARL